MERENLSELAESAVIYTATDCVPSFDKGSHRERSIGNQPNHIKHWRKSVPVKPERQDNNHKKHIKRDGKK